MIPFSGASGAEVEHMYKELDNKDAEIARLGRCLELAKADAEERKKQLEMSKKDLELKSGTLQQLQKQTYNEQMEVSCGVVVSPFRRDK